MALNLSRNGGLPGPKRVPLFLKVLHGADTRDKRLVALKVHAAALTVYHRLMLPHNLAHPTPPGGRGICTSLLRCWSPSVLKRKRRNLCQHL